MTTCEGCDRPCSPGSRWCSQSCHAQSRRNGRDAVCGNCQTVFYLRAAYERKGGYCDRLTDVGLVKIDVELRVIQAVGHQHLLGAVIIECWSHDWYRMEKQWLTERLHEMGYRVVPINGYADVILAEKR